MKTDTITKDYVKDADVFADIDEEAVDVCQAIQEMRMESEQIGERRGEQIGELRKAKETARNFYDLGVDVEKVAQGVGYAVETVKQWLGISDDDQ